MIAIIGIVAILIVFLVIMLSPSGNSLSVPIQPCAEKVIGYANENLVQPGTSVTFKSVAESRGMYRDPWNLPVQDVTIYTTKDCTMLFTNGINMSASVAKASQNPTPSPTPVKTARPSVDLYVMAFCPYGTQAESAMKPVVSLLGTKADIRYGILPDRPGIYGRFGPFTAWVIRGAGRPAADLHPEQYPGKFWDYLDTFNTRCYSLSQNLTRLNACWRNRAQVSDSILRLSKHVQQVPMDLGCSRQMSQMLTEWCYRVSDPAYQRGKILPDPYTRSLQTGDLQRLPQSRLNAGQFCHPHKRLLLRVDVDNIFFNQTRIVLKNDTLIYFLVSAHPWHRVTHGRLNKSFATNRCLHDNMGTFCNPADNGGILPVLV